MVGLAEGPRNPYCAVSICLNSMLYARPLFASTLFIYLTKQVMFKMNKICQMFALDVMVHPLKTSSPGLDYFTQKHF